MTSRVKVVFQDPERISDTRLYLVAAVSGLCILALSSAVGIGISTEIKEGTQLTRLINAHAVVNAKVLEKHYTPESTRAVPIFPWEWVSTSTPETWSIVVQKDGRPVIVDVSKEIYDKVSIGDTL
ncbi:MAG: hypothetical protein ABSE76_03325 [Minisyncoccia bacterium]